MKIHQVSIFLENKPSQLAEPCRLLAKAGIDIRTLTLADTAQFGILRLIVSDWEKAARLLEDARYAINVTEVVAVEVRDRPGGLAELLGVFEKNDINIDYMYAFTFSHGESATMIFRFSNPDAAIERLRAAGINIIGSSEIHGRTEK